MESFGIALIGCGTVGTGVAKLLLEQRERLDARAGKALLLKKIVVSDIEKSRDPSLPRSLFTTDMRSVVFDKTIDCAVEVVGGTTWAKTAVLDLLGAGKDIVTANKALLATHGAEVFDAARKHHRAIAFEASVGGGIPIILALTQGLAANQILSLQGILNGTCNYILTGMSEKGTAYPDALKEAQRLGYAEADPTMDVDGTDAAHKLAILAQLAFNVTVPVGSIPRRGIDEIDSTDIRFARELGYTIKLLAEGWMNGGELALHVSPVMLRHLTPLAQVRDAYNAIFAVGDAVGSTLYYGRGAGQMPTASAVVADVIDLAVGRGQRLFQSLKLWSNRSDTAKLRDPKTIRSRFYLRLMVEDRPGVLADVTRILANHHISISSVIQHEAIEGSEGSVVPLVIMTHEALTGNFLNTLADFKALGSVTAPSVYYPVGD